MKDLLVSHNGVSTIAIPSGIEFEPEAALDALLAVRLLPVEVLGVFKVTIFDNNRIRFSDMYLPHQRVESNVEHELHKPLNLACLEELYMRGESGEDYAVWHSHVDGIARLSMTDIGTIKAQLKALWDIRTAFGPNPEGEFLVGPYIELVFNVDAEASARMDFLYKKDGRDPNDVSSLIHVVYDLLGTQEAFKNAIKAVPRSAAQKRKKVMENIIRERVEIVEHVPDEDEDKDDMSAIWHMMRRRFRRND